MSSVVSSGGGGGGRGLGHFLFLKPTKIQTNPIKTQNPIKKHETRSKNLKLYKKHLTSKT